MAKALRVPISHLNYFPSRFPLVALKPEEQRHHIYHDFPHCKEQEPFRILEKHVDTDNVIY